VNKGQSDKDLDLFLIPLNGFESRPQEITMFLMDFFGSSPRPIRDSPDYAAGDPWHCKEAVIFKYLSKRIDVFIQ